MLFQKADEWSRRKVDSTGATEDRAMGLWDYGVVPGADLKVKGTTRRVAVQTIVTIGRGTAR